MEPMRWNDIIHVTEIRILYFYPMVVGNSLHESSETTFFCLVFRTCVDHDIRTANMKYVYKYSIYLYLRYVEILANGWQQHVEIDTTKQVFYLLRLFF